MAYIKERNGKYIATIRVDGKRIAKTFDTYLAAKVWGEAATTPIPIHHITDKPQYKASFEEVLLRYLSEVTPTHKGWKHEAQMIKQLIRDVGWVKRPFGALSLDEVRRWRDNRLLSVTPATVSRHLDIVKSACKHAEMEWDWVTQVEMLKRIKIERPKQAEKVRRIAPDKIERLLWSADQANVDWLRPVIEFALLTAMRRSEITALRWEHIDFDKKLLLVADTKNGIDRTLPLYDAVANLLQLLPRTGERVFNISSNSLTKGWNRCTKRANVSGVRFHDLRHEAVSRLFDRGLTPIEVAKISGHRTLSMLMRYSHADSDTIIAKLKGVQ